MGTLYTGSKMIQSCRQNITGRQIRTEESMERIPSKRRFNTKFCCCCCYAAAVGSNSCKSDWECPVTFFTCPRSGLPQLFTIMSSLDAQFYVSSTKFRSTAQNLNIFQRKFTTLHKVVHRADKYRLVCCLSIFSNRLFSTTFWPLAPTRTRQFRSWRNCGHEKSVILDGD